MELDKITTATTRRYDDACGTAHALDLVGERWALLVMRELMFGPKRFGDLKAGLPGVSANVLTQRLEGLEAAGLVVRRRLAPPASVRVYELTDWGREAEPIIRELGRWAACSPRHDPTLPLSAVSIMLSFRTMFDAGKSEGLDLSLGFVLGADVFRVTVRDGVLEIERGEAGPEATVIEAQPVAVAGAVYGDGDLGALIVRGETGVARAFAGLFDLPPKAG